MSPFLSSLTPAQLSQLLAVQAALLANPLCLEGDRS